MRKRNSSVSVLLTTFAVLAAAVVSAPAAAAEERRPENVPGSWIVVFRGSVADAKGKTDRLERSEGFKARHRYGKAIKGFSARLSERQVQRLRQDPEVAFVTADRVVRASALEPLVSGDKAPTGVRRMAAATTTQARRSSQADVAVIDTGIDLGHADLNARDGKNCVGPGAAQDDDGHGTHVAGSIAARNNGSGVVGVVPGTRVHAVKVLGADGSGSWSQVICGIDWVTSTRSDADPANDIEVANMSLGGVGTPVAACSTTTDPMHKAVCASTAAGVTYVVAAGNDGWDFDYASAPDTPAAYPQVLTVSAMSDSDGSGGGAGGAPGCDGREGDDRYASFSNFAATSAGQAHTIAGPGVCIESTMPGGGHGLMSGTSMATPHLAGATAACIDGPCAGVTPAQVIERMRSDAQQRTATTSSFGFSGDPSRPVSGRYFGYLSWAGDDSTAPASDTTAPQISAVSPASGAVAVPATATVAVAFDEVMDKASAQAAFSLRRTSDNVSVSGTFSWSGNTLVFRPSALAEGTSYTARVSTGARDASGNGLAADKSWSFKTGITAGRFPFATVLEAGTLRSGSYSRLSADDNVFYQVNSTTSGTRTSSWYARVAGVSNSLSTLRVQYRGRNSLSCAQTVSIWRWTTNSWVQLDSRSVGTTEVFVDKAVGSGFADYVSGTTGDGEVRVRVRCTHGTAAFYASADQVRVVHTRP